MSLLLATTGERDDRTANVEVYEVRPKMCLCPDLKRLTPEMRAEIVRRDRELLDDPLRSAR